MGGDCTWDQCDKVGQVVEVLRWREWDIDWGRVFWLAKAKIVRNALDIGLVT